MIKTILIIATSLFIGMCIGYWEGWSDTKDSLPKKEITTIVDGDTIDITEIYV